MYVEKQCDHVWLVYGLQANVYVLYVIQYVSVCDLVFIMNEYVCVCE
jgi:hypothetical protein